MERKRTGPARRQASNETEARDAGRDAGQQEKNKQYEAVIGGREEQTAPFSHLSPDPLSPIRSPPSASIIPPPPGVGRAGDEAGSPRSPSHPSHHSRHHLIRSRSPHLLIPGVISPHAPFSVAHPSVPPSTLPRRAPGQNALRRSSSGHQSTPRPTTSKTRRRTGRGDGVRFPIVVSIVVLIVVARRRLIAYRPQGFHPGEEVILGAYIPRRFPQLISSAPAHRLIRPTARRSIWAGKQAAVGSRPGIVFRPRLAPRVARAGRRASRSRRPARLAAPVSPFP